MATAAKIESLDSCPAMLSNLIYNGVFSSLIPTLGGGTSALLLLSPTAKTMAFPTPYITRDYDLRNGSIC